MHPDATLALASPANQCSLSWDFDTNTQRLHAGGKWIGARVKLIQNTPDLPDPQQPHCLEDLSPGDLELFISQSRAVCFDDDDRRQFLKKSGISAEGLCVTTIKADPRVRASGKARRHIP